jgi:hypothetical protein
VKGLDNVHQTSQRVPGDYEEHGIPYLQQFESVHALNHVNHSPDSDVGLTILLYNLKTMENSVVDLSPLGMDRLVFVLTLLEWSLEEDAVD